MDLKIRDPVSKDRKIIFYVTISTRISNNLNYRRESMKSPCDVNSKALLQHQG